MPNVVMIRECHCGANLNRAHVRNELLIHLINHSRPARRRCAAIHWRGVNNSIRHRGASRVENSNTQCSGANRSGVGERNYEHECERPIHSERKSDCYFADVVRVAKRAVRCVLPLVARANRRKVRQGLADRDRCDVR